MPPPAVLSPSQWHPSAPALQVVPLKQLSAQELARHDGSDEQLPILLSVRGVVFDVTKGRDFYGPDGAYPFGGRECSRALAKFSTELAGAKRTLAECNNSSSTATQQFFSWLLYVCLLLETCGILCKVSTLKASLSCA